MKFPVNMMHDTVWVDRLNYIEAEEHNQLSKVLKVQITDDNIKSNPPPCQNRVSNARTSPLINEISTMRENIKTSLSGMSTNTSVDNSHVTKLEEENKAMRKLVEDLSRQVAALALRVGKLEGSVAEKPTSAPVDTKKEAEDDDDDDDDFDMFGDDDEDEEEETEEEKKKKEELLKKYHEKKSKKPALIAKSSIILDVKPWDDETDMKEMERLVRTIEMDGLLWGNSKLVPVGYGIHKLQISCVVEDDKVGSEVLDEEITKFEDHVQSVDVAAFNKI